MRSGYMTLLFISVLFLSVTGFAQERQPKIAVMEIIDNSKTLNAEMLAAGAEYLRSEFVSTKGFVVISKERQDKVAIKELKKESYKECYDKQCQIPLAQALSADTMLRSSINFFGGIYTVTVEMVDLAKEATVKGEKSDFDGTEDGLRKALAKIVIQMTGKTVAYNPAVMDEKQRVEVKIGGMELSAIPQVKVKEETFTSIDTGGLVAELKIEATLNLEAPADLLVLYDKAVDVDKRGRENPQFAIEAWKKVADFKDPNPYRKTAQDRITDWKKNIRYQELAEIYNAAVASDKYGNFFPQEAITGWKALMNDPNDNPYFEKAVRRYSEWTNFAKGIENYTANRKQFEEQHKKDVETLIKVLPLKILGNKQKKELLLRYIEIYSPFYGVEDYIYLIDVLTDQVLIGDLKGMINNEVTRREAVQSCSGGKPVFCYLAGSMIEVENPKASMENYAKACEGGIITACNKAGAISFEKTDMNSPKYFKKSCEWGSSKGCHNMAYLAEIGFGMERSTLLSARLYTKACGLGNETSCAAAGKVREIGFSSKQAESTYLMLKEIKGAKNDGVLTESEQMQMNKRLAEYKQQQAQKKIAEKKPKYPYLWWGVGLAGAGVALSGAGLGLNLAAVSKFDEYNRLSKIETMNGLDQSSYISKAESYRNDGKKLSAAAISLYVIGGVSAVTGVILALIPGETEPPKVGFYLDGKSVMLSYCFDY